MKSFWKALGKGLAKAAVWCVGHPEEIVAIVKATKKKT